MKKLLCELFLFGFLQVGIFLGLYHCSPLSESYYAATTLKHHRLESVSSPRIIFVGGSNLSFGLDSALVQKELGLEPVNMGLYAGLGLIYMLNEVKPSLRQGDMIVLSPEYALLYNDGRGPRISELLLVAPSHIQFVTTWPQWKELLDSTLFSIGWMSRSAVASLLDSVILKVMPKYSSSERLYQKNAFNAYGDLIKHWTMSSKPFKITPLRENFDTQQHDYILGQLNSFQRYCEDKGCRLLFSNPPVLDEQYQKQESLYTRIYTRTKEKIHFPMMDRLDDMIYSRDLFFNTTKHLNRIGVAKRTRHVIQAFQQIQ